MAPKILVIDDEFELVLTVRDALTARGYDVVTSTDGADGLRKVKKESPDLVICDVRMPGIDGWGVLKSLRDNTSKWVPVIMLTAMKELSDIKRGYDGEADYYITKPFKVNELLDGVRVVLSLRSARG